MLDPSDASSIVSVLNASQHPDVAAGIPSEMLEHKHKKKYLRKEAKLFDNSRPFTRSFNEKALLNYLIELVTKAGNLLNCVGSQGRPADPMKILEMSLNKADILLDKSKMIVLKLESIFVIVPFTIAKIEVRMRNMIINMRPKFEAISRFTKIYLDVYSE